VTNDTVVMRKRLREETAAMLKLDVNNLTAAQSVRLDRASTLRLELNDIEERKLIGAQFDTAKYIAASEALERMLGGNPDQPAAAETDEQRRERWANETFAGAAEELNALLGRRHDAIEQRRKSLEVSRAASLEAGTAEQQQQPSTGPYLPVAQQRAPAAELAPEHEEPPINSARVTYLDLDGPNEPLRPPPETPTERYARVNGGNPTPAQPAPRSPTTTSYFANAPGNAGMRRFDPPEGF
jgi:hypothetical protein